MPQSVFIEIIEIRKCPEVGVYRKCKKEPVLQLRGEWAAGFIRFCRFFCLVLKRFCLFQLLRNRCETPKQTEKNVFRFRETNRKTTETD
jgi:hypothetical protein